MGDLAVLVPSRGRPHNMARLIEAMDPTCRGDTTLIVGVDEDDPTLQDYVGLGGCDGRHGRTHGQLVRWLNILALTFVKEYRSSATSGTTTFRAPSAGTCESWRASTGTMFCFGDDLDPGREPGSTVHPHRSCAPK